MSCANIILIKHFGGLGNQMYQYALARQLSLLNNNAIIKSDIGYYNNYCWSFELNKLNIKSQLATNTDIFNLDNGTLPRALGKIIDKIPWIRVKDFIRKPFSNVFTEQGLGFNPKMLEIRKDVYLKGYWASFKYFQNIRDVLLEDFEFKAEMNDDNKRIAENIINSKNAVSLHIRRGDYLSSGNQSMYYSPYKDGFYYRAIEKLEKETEELEFFLFSDDPAWVKENLKIDHKFTIVDINKKENSYWDMKLMSLCKHNIIANSTFSWWGAWLNKNPSKIVIAPKRWMADPTFKLDDTIPSDWFVL